ncbi:RNA polymerase sigma factor RpoE [soil metagenome]
MTADSSYSLDNDDIACVNKTLAGDSRAFEVLVKRHQGLVYNLLNGMVQDSELARDLTQDAFLKAYRNLKQFDQRHYKTVKPWLIKIATNNALDHLRQSKSTISLDQILSDEPYLEPSTNKDASVDAEHIMFVEKLNQALMLLPLRYRQAFVLRYQFEFSYDEISKSMEENENTVRTLLFRAKDRLRKIIMGKSGRADNVTGL